MTLDYCVATGRLYGTRGGAFELADGVDNLWMESCRLAVRLTPCARADEVVGERDGVLVVRVTAAPEGGRANAALCRLLAKRAGVGVRCVSVVRGAASREKIVRVEGISAEGLRRALKLEAKNERDAPGRAGFRA